MIIFIPKPFIPRCFIVVGIYCSCAADRRSLSSPRGSESVKDDMKNNNAPWWSFHSTGWLCYTHLQNWELYSGHIFNVLASGEDTRSYEHVQIFCCIPGSDSIHVSAEVCFLELCWLSLLDYQVKLVISGNFRHLNLKFIDIRCQFYYPLKRLGFFLLKISFFWKKRRVCFGESRSPDQFSSI